MKNLGNSWAIGFEINLVGTSVGNNELFKITHTKDVQDFTAGPIKQAWMWIHWCQQRTKKLKLKNAYFFGGVPEWPSQ